MPLDLQPVETSNTPKLDLQPVEAKLDLRDSEGEAPTLMDFMRHEDAAATEASPLTPAASALPGGLETPFPATERQVIEQQIPENDTLASIGEKLIKLPNVGEEGTRVGEASRVITGVGEWALNNPLEAVVSLHPLGQAALTAKYGPDIARQIIRDVPKALRGDAGAQGRLIAMGGLLFGPKALKKADESYLMRGPAAGSVASPLEIAERATMPGVEGERLRDTVTGVKAIVGEGPQVPVDHAAAQPMATETFKEIVSGDTKPAAPAAALPGEANAISQQSTAAPIRDVLRSDEGGQSETSGMPQGIDESSQGVRSNEDQRAPGTSGQKSAQARIEPQTASDAPTPESEVNAARGTGDTQIEEAKVEPPPSETLPATGNEAAVPQTIGIKNASVDQQRANRGLPPIMEPLRKADPVLWDAAMKRVEADPALPERLTLELTEHPRPMTDEETVIMERHIADLTNQLDQALWEGIKAGDAAEAAAERRRAATTPEERAAAALEVADAEGRAAHYEGEAGKMSDALSVVEQAVGRQTVEGGPGAGTLMGRAFRARQLMMREDFSYAGLERQARGAVGFRKLTADEAAAVEHTAREWKARNDELQKRLNAQVEVAAKAEAARQLAELQALEAKAQAAVTGRVRAIVNKVGEVLDARAELARSRLRGKVLSLSPADLKDIAEIAASNLFHIGEDLARWSVKMIEDVGEKVRPHLDVLWVEAKRLVEEAARGATAASEAPKRAKGSKAGAKAGAPTDEAAVQEAIQKRIKARIAEYERRIAAGDYSPWRKPPVAMSKETLRAHFELEQVKRRFYEGLVEMKMAQRTRVQRVYGGTVEAVNAMRAVLTSADLSAVLRQGLLIGVAHPLRAARSIVPMLKAFASEQKAWEVERQIQARDNYPLYRASKLYLAEHGAALSRMEEAYMSRLASKLPLVGRVVKSSERAYITYLNKLRADSFDAMAASLGKGGNVTIEQARILSNYINVATGRGTILMADQAAAGLNTVFFAPRFVASRFQMLLGQPLYYGLLSGKAPLAAKGALHARALVAAEYGRVLTGMGVVYGLGVAAGAQLETDPRSSDFGKLRFGNTRIDLMAGLSQITVLLSKIATGEKKSLRTGRILPLVAEPGKKLRYGSEDLDDTLKRFARYKLAPAPGLAWSYLSGTDAVGNPVTAGSLAANALVPISLQDIYGTLQEQGMPEGAAISLLSIFGAGVQNFDVNRKR